MMRPAAQHGRADAGVSGGGGGAVKPRARGAIPYPAQEIPMHGMQRGCRGCKQPTIKSIPIPVQVPVVQKLEMKVVEAQFPPNFILQFLTGGIGCIESRTRFHNAMIALSTI